MTKKSISSTIQPIARGDDEASFAYSSFKKIAMKETSVLAVKFNSILPSEELNAVCEKDLFKFRKVPGLVQKYYIVEESSGALSGLYFFESKAARTAFWNSPLAKEIPGRYGVIPESLRVEQYEIDIILNEAVEA